MKAKEPNLKRYKLSVARLVARVRARDAPISGKHGQLLFEVKKEKSQ
jgi:hypothetical protein